MVKKTETCFLMAFIVIIMLTAAFFAGYQKALKDNSVNLEDSIKYVEWRINNLPKFGTTISEYTTIKQLREIYFSRHNEAQEILRWELIKICGINTTKVIQNVSH